MNRADLFIVRAILTLAFALAPWLASAGETGSGILSGILIETYWVEAQQSVDKSFPSTQNNRLSLFVVDPRRYTVEMVRNGDKSADRRYAIEGAGAFGALRRIHVDQSFASHATAPGSPSRPI